MSDETKAILEELKEIRLALFRSAATLDNAIESVELFLNDKADDEYKRMSIIMQRNYRDELRRVFKYDKIDDKEKDAWQRLIDSLK